MSHHGGSREGFLEWAFVWNFVVHGVALLSMVAFLLPVLPGGTTVDDVERVARLAAHPWLFRLGWLPWQLCAVFDLLLAIAMVRARIFPRVSVVFVAAATVVAVIFDQLAQVLWITHGVTLAQRDRAAYLAFEHWIYPLTASYAAMAYTAAAFGWTHAFSRAAIWSRPLTALSVPLWSTMVVAAIAPSLPVAIRPSPTAIAVCNAVAFPMLQLWLALVGEQLLRRRRPFESYGRSALWRHPGDGVLARVADLAANSRFLTLLFEPLPAFAMESDITDVVYVNYIVSASRVARLVPAGLELQRLGPEGQYALVTFLTYRHGHFGFRFLGPARRVMPSPIQSNWRIHVRNPRDGTLGIYFLTTGLTSTALALGARLTAEAMPMHVFANASITRTVDGTIKLRLEPGHGSAPDANATLVPATEPVLDDTFAACFGSFREFLAYCVPQDRALSTQPERGRVTRQEISLGIPIEACEPLTGEVVSRAAEALVGGARPVCFRVPSVRFRFISEVSEPLGDAPTTDAVQGAVPRV